MDNQSTLVCLVGGAGQGANENAGQRAGQSKGIGGGAGEGVGQGEGIGEGAIEGIGLDCNFSVDKGDGATLESNEFMVDDLDVSVDNVEIDSNNEYSSNLVDAIFSTDDEELVEGRKNIREFHKRVTKGWIIAEPLTEVVPS
ncbi:hypothetical protein NL676_015604 [Syzygium grande]|nr:hypothetical protein NL676_015604 [Syzygium grande]